ncbi:MAG: TMEM165/GDT1 family protein [Sciscionella sp.]
MPDLAVVITVFVVTFLAELPDKSLFASLVLGSRYRPSHVWLGVAAAFAVHVALAVTVGGLLALAPHRAVEAVSAALFLLGAAWMLRSGREDDSEPGPDAARYGQPTPSLLRVAATSFVVVFVGEWGDITQITTANFTARYDPMSVALGAVLALWIVSALAVFAGTKVLARIPVQWVRVISALILTGFGVYSTIQALTG